MGKRKNNHRKKKKKNSYGKTTSIGLNEYWPDTEKSEPEQSSNTAPPLEAPSNQPPPQPDPQLSEEQQEQQRKIGMKLQLLIREYGFTERCLQKADRMWMEARSLPYCEKLPNPCEWILNHEYLHNYWTNLRKQIDTHGVDINAPHLKPVVDQNSLLSKYMNYMDAYFKD